MVLEKPKKEFYHDFETFVDEGGGIDFPNIVFRPSAPFTSQFGLTERYEIAEVDGVKKMVWGYPGIHGGYDRGGITPIHSPFNFGSSGFYDFGGRDYGSQILLYHKHNFRLMVAHCYPDEIYLKGRLQKGYAIAKGSKLALPGSYGNSTGIHTHTEIEAWGYHGQWEETSPVLDWILETKYGEEARIPLTDAQIIEKGGRCTMMIDDDDNVILGYVKKLLKFHRIVFINDYKFIYENSVGRRSTKYNTKKLFGM
jgi:murein DD-endopeptidase MepM/ murein hydrolase activator NlpD